MCCNSSGNNCNCSCENITLEQIAGPTGPQGPAGTTVLYWNTSTLSSVTTGSDVLLATYVLPANQLITNGDEIQIEITGQWANNAIRYLKLDINNSAITTIAQSTGVLVNGVFLCKVNVTRVSNTSTEGYSTSFWNSGSTTQGFVGYPYTTDFSSSQQIRIYVNQNIASSVIIDSIKLKKAVF